MSCLEETPDTSNTHNRYIDGPEIKKTVKIIKKHRWSVISNSVVGQVLCGLSE